MLVVAAVSVFALAILWLLSPGGELIHAARSRNVFFRRRAFPLAALYQDESGNPIDVSNSVVGIAAGSSCVSYGIQNGATVIADRLSGAADELRKGDLVVINSELVNGTRPQRFRCVDRIVDGVVHFRADETGPLKSKHVGEILARVKYVQA